VAPIDFKGQFGKKANGFLAQKEIAARAGTPNGDKKLGTSQRHENATPNGHCASGVRA
jgi:hypothetical protein